MDAPIYTGGHARRSLIDTVTFRLLSQITTPLALIIQVRGMTEKDAARIVLGLRRKERWNELNKIYRAHIAATIPPEGG